MKQKLAISYVRYSTTGQSDGDSVRRQTEATEAYCRKHGLTLTDAYRLKDLGKSAFRGLHRSETGALGQFEKDVQAGKIPKGTVLIVENLDRLSREDIVSAQLLLLNLINQDIEIVALSDNERRYSKESLMANPMELFISIMVMSRAHEESKIKSYRVKESWLNRKKLAAEGKHINIRLPSWLESKDDRYKTDPAKVEVIKRIFELYISGYGTQTIAGLLCTANVPNIAKQIRGRSDRWHATNIQRILKAKEVIGFYTGTSPAIPGFFPAIISETDFYACQAKLAMRYNYKGQRNHTPHPFSHLLKCAHCGKSIVKAHGNGYRYLQCQGARVKMCKPETLPYYATEQALLKVLASIGPTASSLDDNAAANTQHDIEALQGRINEVNEKIATATTLFMETPSEAGAKILQQLESDRKSFGQQLEDKRNSTFLIDHRADWKDIKTTLEAAIINEGNLPLQVIPVSIKKENGELVFVRHMFADNRDDVIALRENLKTYIERIDIDIQQMIATIRFRSGERVKVELKKTHSYPRRYFFKTDKTDWAEIAPEPQPAT